MLNDSNSSNDSYLNCLKNFDDAKLLRKKELCKLLFVTGSLFEWTVNQFPIGNLTLLRD